MRLKAAGDGWWLASWPHERMILMCVEVRIPRESYCQRSMDLLLLENVCVALH